MKCTFLLALAILLSAPLHGTTVIPSVLPNNPNCNTLCSGCYSELKVDPPEEGTFTDSVLTVNISNATYKPDDEDEMMSFDWSGNIAVRAVIVKAGNEANVYEYDPAVTSDTYLVPPGKHAISHITFCYVPPQIEYTVTGLKNLTIDQPLIGQWAAAGEFKALIGNPNDSTCLNVSVTANVSYNIYISYSYSMNPMGSLPSPEEPLSYQWNSTWYTIPKLNNWAPLHGLSGTATHSYPVAVDLTQLGDRTANDSITFTIHVMVTQ